VTETRQRKGATAEKPPGQHKGARTRKPRAVPTACDTIPSFCAACGFSQAFYHKLQNQGLGPREFRVGARVFISHEARDDWIREREAATQAKSTTSAQEKSSGA
jgi:hypothetical protein